MDINWNRVADRALFIPRGPDDAFDASTIYTANRPVILDDEIRIYYGGIKHSHGNPAYHGGKYDKSKLGSGIGLATLRLDGFVSISAGDVTGTLTTKPLRFNGDQLTINADAADGIIKIEILGDNGKPIPGYNASFTGDALRHQVKWQGAKDLSALIGRTVRLRFHLQRADLYSLKW